MSPANDDNLSYVVKETWESRIITTYRWSLKSVFYIFLSQKNLCRKLTIIESEYLICFHSMTFHSDSDRLFMQAILRVGQQQHFSEGTSRVTEGWGKLYKKVYGIY